MFFGSIASSHPIGSLLAEVVMNTMRMLALPAGLLAAVLTVGGCQRSKTTASESAAVEVDGVACHVSGPYTHENLSVFLIHSRRQDRRNFLTLPEGLKEKTVRITEKEEEEVGELLIDNQSDRPLYLQEGERLQGGKQDRTIIASLVVPPHSGKMVVPTACIEQSRWVEGTAGKKFGFTLNGALAPKGVRGAAKVENSQRKVWACVEVQKMSGQARLKTRNTNSSANEMLDSPQAQQISNRYAKELNGPLSRHGDAVGVVIVINGQIEEVNVYPSHALLSKLYPRLVRSYALQAALLKDQAKATEPLTPAQIARFMREGKEKSATKKMISTANEARVQELEGNKFICTTRYKGDMVHWQLMKKNGLADGEDRGDAKKADVEMREKALGTDW
jgi:hypothetical protein